MIFKGTAEPDWTVTVYTYKDNNIVEVGSDEFSHCAMYIMNGQNYLKKVNGQTGYEIVYKFYMDNSYNLVVEKIYEKELSIGEDYESGDQLLENYPYDNFDAINNY